MQMKIPMTLVGQPPQLGQQPQQPVKVIHGLLDKSANASGIANKMRIAIKIFHVLTLHEVMTHVLSNDGFKVVLRRKIIELFEDALHHHITSGLKISITLINALAEFIDRCHTKGIDLDVKIPDNVAGLISRRSTRQYTRLVNLREKQLREEFGW